MGDLGRQTYADGFFHGLMVGMIVMGILAAVAR